MSAKSDAPGTVLLVLPWSPAHAGGVSVVVRQLAKQLPQFGAPTTIVVNDWGAARPQRDRDGSHRFRFAGPTDGHAFSVLKWLLALPVQLPRTARFLRALRAEVVNFHYPSLSALTVALIARLTLYRGRLTLSFHGTDVRRPASVIDALLWRFLLKSADGVSACSGSLANDIAATFGVRREDISVIYNGVDTDCFRPDTFATGSMLSGLPAQYLVSVGSYIARKGHLTLLEAFARLSGDFPSLGLVIVGGDGEERGALLGRAEELGLSSRLVCFVDLDQQTVAEVIAHAKACVQPSLAEPFGMAVIEAGACGVPVLASAVGGHLEILREGVTGVLFPAGDAAQCARQIRRTLENPELSHLLAQRFRTEIIDKYSWKSCALAYLQLARWCRAAGS